MATNLHALIRYRTIDRCVRQTDKSWNWEALAEACGEALSKEMGIDKRPSRRTIMEDVKNMRSGKLGYHAPINYDRREKTFYYTDTKFSIDRTPITEGDITELKNALMLLRQFSGRQNVQGIENMITNLEETFKIKKYRQRQTILFEQSLNEPGHQ